MEGVLQFFFLRGEKIVSKTCLEVAFAWIFAYLKMTKKMMLMQMTTVDLTKKTMLMHENVSIFGKMRSSLKMKTFLVHVQNRKGLAELMKEMQS